LLPLLLRLQLLRLPVVFGSWLPRVLQTLLL
jgi:hypothetical protein